MMRKTFALLIATALVASPVLANTNASTGGGGHGNGGGGGGHSGGHGGGGHGSVNHANSLSAIHARGAAHAVSARTADHGHHHHRHYGTQTAYAAQNTGHWQPCYEASQVQVNNLCVGPQKVRVP